MNLHSIKWLNNLKKEDKMKFSHLIEMSYSNSSQTSDFLDEREFELWKKVASHCGIEYKVIEKVPNCGKRVIYFNTSNDSIDSVTIYYGECKDNITHRQVLGSLFGIGLNTNTIGDILVEDNHFYFTNLTRLNDFVEKNLLSIGKKPVMLKTVDSVIWNKDLFITFNITINSMRLDSIISKIVGTSRSKAQDLINNHSVLVNFDEAVNITYLVKENDIISIYRVGKFKIGNVVGNTKKNKIILEINKYN